MTTEEKIKQASSAYTAKQGGILSEKVANAFIAGANFGREIGRKDGWIDVNDHLPDELETVWITNGKGWTTLGCIGYEDGEWLWAEAVNLPYEEFSKGKAFISAECELDDLDVKFWHRLPKPIKV